jgi:hypothetical protein
MTGNGIFMSQAVRRMPAASEMLERSHVTT